MLAKYHNDYLSKPISREQLLTKLSNLLPVDWLFADEPKNQSSLIQMHPWRTRRSHPMMIWTVDQLCGNWLYVRIPRKTDEIVSSGDSTEAFLFNPQRCLAM